MLLRLSANAALLVWRAPQARQAIVWRALCSGRAVVQPHTGDAEQLRALRRRVVACQDALQCSCQRGDVLGIRALSPPVGEAQQQQEQQQQSLSAAEAALSVYWAFRTGAEERGSKRRERDEPT